MPAKKPATPFPAPAAVHPGEADLLAAVVANLADDTAKLVYADWLEERGDPRGPFLRAFVAAFRAGAPLPDTNAAPKPWRDLVGVNLCERIAAEPAIRPKADRVLALARPAVEYTKDEAKRSLPVGATKLGGRPDLPPGAAWPEFDGLPLGFIGQFNLADLAPSPVARELPAAGLLSLFCLRDENRTVDDFPPGTYRVVFTPDPGELERRPFPNALWREARLPTRRLTFAEAVTIPDPDTAAVKRVVRGEAESTAYDNVHSNTLGNDHLLGHPKLLRPERWRKTDRHLLTVGDVPGWVDDDVMYFTLSEADLKAGRLDRATMTLRQF